MPWKNGSPLLYAEEPDSVNLKQGAVLSAPFIYFNFKWLAKYDVKLDRATSLPFSMI
jgi:hypothetical protein